MRYLYMRFARIAQCYDNIFANRITVLPPLLFCVLLYAHAVNAPSLAISFCLKNECSLTVCFWTHFSSAQLLGQCRAACALVNLLHPSIIFSQRGMRVHHCQCSVDVVVATATVTGMQKPKRKKNSKKLFQLLYLHDFGRVGPCVRALNQHYPSLNCVKWARKTVAHIY